MNGLNDLMMKIGPMRLFAALGITAVVAAALFALSDAYAAELYPAESNHMVDAENLAQPHVIEALVNHLGGVAKAGIAGVYNKAVYRTEKRAALAKMLALRYLAPRYFDSWRPRNPQSRRQDPRRPVALATVQTLRRSWSSTARTSSVPCPTAGGVMSGRVAA